MAHRRKLDEPGVMDRMLAGIDARSREYWIGVIEKYENEKPGDIVLPGVPARRFDVEQSVAPTIPKKANRKVRKAA